MPDKRPQIPFETPPPRMSRKAFLLGAAATLSVLTSQITRAIAAGATSKPPQTPDADEVAPGVFVHTGVHGIYTPENHGDISNSAFVIGDESVAVIDTGGTYLVGKMLREAIRKRTDRPIRFVINTHMHPDHVFGNAAFKPDDPEFVAHYKMARGLAARAKRYLAINKTNAGEEAFKGTEVVLPTRGVKTKESINLGGRELILEPQKTAHTDNDLLITDTSTNTLFLGDLLFAGHCPAIDGSILGWIKVLETLKSRPGARVVPGHGPAHMPWPDALQPLEQYLQTIVKEVRVHISQGTPLQKAMDTTALSEKDNWLLFEEFHKRNVSVAYAELEWE